MRLYHGSVVEVRRPSLRYSRKKTDFGRGFYTTTQAEQAENWTIIEQDRTKAPRRIVSVYEIDDALLSNPVLKIREFHGVDEAWLEFVVNSRKGIQHDMIWSLAPLPTTRFSPRSISTKAVSWMPLPLLRSSALIGPTTSCRFIRRRLSRN